jgi:CheY-like chemotaxis protein
MLNNRCNPILIVDDDRQSQRILTNYLKSLTEEVVCVSSGQEALDLLHERPPSAVLMDLEMPGMDGIETMQEIRKTESQEGRSPVPIVIQTALAMEQAKQQCLSAGADAFLEKPIDPDELYGTLYHVLDSDTK